MTALTDILRPGMRVRTSYGTGGIITKITGPHGRNGDGFDIVYRTPHMGPRSGDCYLNGYVVRDGQITNGRDTITIEADPKTVAESAEPMRPRAPQKKVNPDQGSLF